MNARLIPETLILSRDHPQAELPLAAEGVLRYVWQHRFGSMLVEVRDGQVFVDGKHVESAAELVLTTGVQTVRG